MLRRSIGNTWNPLSLAWLASAWLALACNWPLWAALRRLPEMDSWEDVFFAGALGLIVWGLTAIFLTLAAWRLSIKPAIATCLLSASLTAHFMGTYNIFLDPHMMVNVLQTDPRETRDLLNLHLVGSVVVLAGLPLLGLRRVHVAQMPGWRQARRNAFSVLVALAVMAALLGLFFEDMSTTMRNHKSLRYLVNPLSSFYSLGVVALATPSRSNGPLIAVGTDVALATRAPDALPPLLLIVIGETARADHFSLNGYERNTNPQLAQRNILSFKNVSSCGTSTARSLPCMFSVFGKAAFEAETQHRENLLDVLQRAGLAVLWVDNQAGCKGQCDRIPSAEARDAVQASPPPQGMCDDSGECFDEALLHGLSERIAALPAERRARGVAVVLHQMGSHGPAYWKRSPPDRKPFQPECTTNVLQRCTREALVNTYDNSVAYTDQVLANAIDWLGQRASTNATALLYVSDHGESLGEKNLYLHGMPYALAPHEQTHVPMMAWLSKPVAASLNARCISQQLEATLSHDHLSHTVMGLLGVKTGVYDSGHDVFGACRRR